MLCAFEIRLQFRSAVVCLPQNRIELQFAQIEALDLSAGGARRFLVLGRKSGAETIGPWISLDNENLLHRDRLLLIDKTSQPTLRLKTVSPH